MKKIILIIVSLLFMQSNSSSVEKQDCANIKKISPKYLSCKIKNFLVPSLLYLNQCL